LRFKTRQRSISCEDELQAIGKIEPGYKRTVDFKIEKRPGVCQRREFTSDDRLNHTGFIGRPKRICVEMDKCMPMIIGQ